MTYYIYYNITIKFYSEKFNSILKFSNSLKVRIFRFILEEFFCFLKDLYAFRKLRILLANFFLYIYSCDYLHNHMNNLKKRDNCVISK